MAWIRSLARELPYALGAAKKKKEKKGKEKIKKKTSGTFFFRAILAAYGGSQARGQIRAVSAGLHHSHSNTGSEPRETYTTARGNAGSLTPERGQGVNPRPQGY